MIPLVRNQSLLYAFANLAVRTFNTLWWVVVGGYFMFSLATTLGVYFIPLLICAILFSVFHEYYLEEL
jgi:hypothetical protein